MKVLNISFLIFLLSYIILISAIKLGYNLPDFLIFYAADLLCMPIVLYISLRIVQFLRKDKTLRISLFTIISLTVAYSIYFEYYLPKVHARYTADAIDVLMYVIGSFTFYILQKKSFKT